MDLVLQQEKGPIRVITLNRPQRRNAIDLELRVVLAEALEAAMAEDSVRAVVLTGAGGAFCSGGDIGTMRRQPAEQTVPRIRAAQRVIQAIWSGDKPVVAAVEGFAVGAGASLALACDRVVAARDAVFSANFTKVGLAGDMGIFASLPARVGVARARQLLMLPHKLSAAEALDIGMADALAEPGSALDDALRDAERIAEGPMLAIAEMKHLLGAGALDREEVLEREVAMQARLFDTEDFAEGVAAFGERRRPAFRGR